MDRVKGKVVIVTGGALGLGKSACLLLAREGAKVVVTDIKEREGAEVANLIKASGGDATFMVQDAGSETDWARVILETKKVFNRIDAVVNNAGLGIGGNVEDTTLEDWRKLMRVNLDGVFLGTKYGIRAMKEHSSGSIINLSSIEGLVGDPQSGRL